MAKITFIGAGSVVFAKKLIGDLLQFPALAGSTIALMDRDPARLKVAESVTQRMVTKLGCKARVVATLDRTEAIRDANYVICTVQVGGFAATRLDFDIPARYGLQQTIADTLGVGGVFRGLRTIPVLLDIARDVASVGAPHCLLLNYSNPMAMNCWAVAQAVGIPHVGLCHSVQGTSRLLAGFAGLPYEEVRYLVAGINHMAFFLRFEYRGQDAYPLLFQALDDPRLASEFVRFEMMRRLGYFVTESSEHQSEYVPYFIHHGSEVVNHFRIPINEYIRRSQAIMARWQETERELLGGEGDIAIEPQSFEYGAHIVHAGETNRPTLIYGNVPNTGLITNLPAGCCVEVPVLADGTGLHPTAIGELPPQLAAIIRTNVNVQELTVAAALGGRRDHIYHAVMMDPHTSAALPLDKIWRMCDELIDAHQQAGWLGKLEPTAPNTGRPSRGLTDQAIAGIELVTELATMAGGETRVEVLLSNPRDTAVSAVFELHDPAGVIEPGAAGKFVLNAAPASTVRHALAVQTCRDITGELNLMLRTDMLGVLCRGLVVKPRRRIIAGADGRASFELELAGLPAARVTVQDAGDAVLFSAQVQDSDIITRSQGREPWDSSGLRLFIARESGAAIRELYLLPNPAHRRVEAIDAAGAVLATGELAAKETEYTLSARIPKSALGLAEEDTRFLCEVHAFLNALGDAHSGGLCALVNQFSPWSRDVTFARIELK